MTTFEEISTDERKNREFWTERARLSLFFYREHKVNDPASSLSYKMGFRSNMKYRREKKYFEPTALKQAA